MEELAEQAGPAFDSLAGIAICGITRTQVFLDDSGAPIRPAISFRDARAGDEAAWLKALAPDGWAEGAHLNPFHPAARLAWLAGTSRKRPAASPRWSTPRIISMRG